MQTKLLPINDASIAEAARLFQNEQVVAIPTETVYGLAGSALSGVAVRRIFEAKGRPQDNPLIVHIADVEALPVVAREVSPEAKALAEAFWPGPLTMVLPKGSAIAPEVCAGLETVGVRLPAHPAARAVIRAAGLPLAAPSANRSGSPSPTTAAHVQADMDGRIPLILDGGRCPVGVESTVLSLVGPSTVLRPGFVTAAEISDVLGHDVALSPYVERQLEESARPESPGMKYRHYSPKAEITIIDADFEDYLDFLSQLQISDLPKKEAVFALCFTGEEAALTIPAVTFGRADDPASQAERLFSALRELDENGADIVYARMPNPDGVGLAVRNRLLRASGFRIIEHKRG